MRRLDYIRERHYIVFSKNDIEYLLNIALELDRLWQSDHRIVDLSDTAYSAIDNLSKLMKEEMILG